MAVTSSVLVNDGGAPARILNFLADEAITAGGALEFTTAGKLQMADMATNFLSNGIAGFALTDAADGDMCSMITGSGIVLNVHVDGATDVVVGDNLILKLNNAGALSKKVAYADGTDSPPSIAVALEAATLTAAQHADVDTGGGVQLFKVLVL
jgi:hypothetical protein